MTNEQVKALHGLLRRIPNPDTVMGKTIELCELLLVARADAVLARDVAAPPLHLPDDVHARIESYRP